MKFIKLKLYTNIIEQQYDFYCLKLGFPVNKKTDHSFSINIGWTELEFVYDNSKINNYHYCILIPTNYLTESQLLISQKASIYTSKEGKTIIDFESWNARSFYFKDPSGNLVEFIIHNDYKCNLQKKGFEIVDCLGICEIGLPTQNIQKTNTILEENLKSKFWKGDYNRFGTHGSIEGKFLLPNTYIKNKWFPTNQKIQVCNFEVVLTNNETTNKVSFYENNLNFNLIE